MFWPICPPAFFRCLSNSGTFTELRTTSFIEITGVACSDSVCHNWVQMLSIPVYYTPVVRIEPATFRWLSSKLYPVITNGIRTGDPRGFNKGRSSKFREWSWVRQTPEEGRRTYRPKHCGNNNKDEDNSPKNLNDKYEEFTCSKWSRFFLLVVKLFALDRDHLHHKCVQISSIR